MPVPPQGSSGPWEPPASSRDSAPCSPRGGGCRRNTQRHPPSFMLIQHNLEKQPPPAAEPAPCSFPPSCLCRQRTLFVSIHLFSPLQRRPLRAGRNPGAHEGPEGAAGGTLGPGPSPRFGLEVSVLGGQGGRPSNPQVQDSFVSCSSSSVFAPERGTRRREGSPRCGSRCRQAGGGQRGDEGAKPDALQQSSFQQSLRNKLRSVKGKKCPQFSQVPPPGRCLHGQGWHRAPRGAARRGTTSLGTQGSEHHGPASSRGPRD